MRFLRPVRADGRKLIGEVRFRELAPDTFYGDVEVRDADGQLVGCGSGASLNIDSTMRAGRTRAAAERTLATLLFTDIVDSTKHAERLGDAGWRDLLDSHREAVRREIRRFYGKEVDNAGDGFFARFESPARAIEAARAVRASTKQLGIEIRLGVHTGECEIDGNTVSGMAVHIAARVQGKAQPSEILVTSTVKDLAVGSGVRFEEAGEHELKGIPDRWRLYSVSDG